jgi:hypothetical protein
MLAVTNEGSRLTDVLPLFETASRRSRTQWIAVLMSGHPRNWNGRFYWLGIWTPYLTPDAQWVALNAVNFVGVSNEHKHQIIFFLEPFLQSQNRYRRRFASLLVRILFPATRIAVPLAVLVTRRILH